jgi:hypothetical protein
MATQNIFPIPVDILSRRDGSGNVGFLQPRSHTVVHDPPVLVLYRVEKKSLILATPALRYHILHAILSRTGLIIT